MSDPIRLLDDPAAPGSVTELVRAIEVPAPLGDAGRVALGARIGATVSAAPVAAVKLLTLKVGLVALAAGGGAALLAVALHRPEPAPAKPAVAAVAPAEPARERALLPAPASPPVEVVPPEAPRRAASAARPSARDTLALEESLLERARESLGTPSRALALLAEHERRFPAGELTAERLYLSARAHQKAGSTAQARKYAQALAQRFPKSTYLAGVRSLLEAR